MAGATWNTLSPEAKHCWKCGTCQSATATSSTLELGDYIENVVAPLRANESLKALTAVICSLFMKIRTLESQNATLHEQFKQSIPITGMEVNEGTPVEAREKKVLLIGDEGVKPFKDIKSVLEQPKGFTAKSAPHKAVPNVLQDVQETLRCYPGDYNVFIHCGQFDCINQKGKEAIEAIEVFSQQLPTMSPGSKLSVATVPNHNDQCRAFNDALAHLEREEKLDVVNLENIQVSLVLGHRTSYDEVSADRAKKVFARRIATYLGTKVKKAVATPRKVVARDTKIRDTKNRPEDGVKKPPNADRQKSHQKDQQNTRRRNWGSLRRNPPQKMQSQVEQYRYQYPYMMGPNAWANGPPPGLFRPQNIRW